MELMYRAIFVLLALSCLASGQTPQKDSLATPELAREGPGLKQFPKELLLNFQALVSTDNIVSLAVGATATAVSKIPNGRVEAYFAGKPEKIFGEPGEYMGSAWVAAPTIAGMLLLGRKSEDARFRSFTYSLAQGHVINQSIAMGIKKTARSQRPNGENSLSFPSGHTASAFTWATTVDHYYGHKAGVLAYLAATYVGYSRLDERAHRLTDVVAGQPLATSSVRPSAGQPQPTPRLARDRAPGRRRSAFAPVSSAPLRGLRISVGP